MKNDNKNIPTPFVSVRNNLCSIEWKSRLMEIFSKKCDEQFLAMSAWEVIIAKLPLKLSNTLPKEYKSLHRAVNGKETLISESSFNTRREEKNSKTFHPSSSAYRLQLAQCLRLKIIVRIEDPSIHVIRYKIATFPYRFSNCFLISPGQPTKVITIAFTFTPAANDMKSPIKHNVPTC